MKLLKNTFYLGIDELHLQTEKRKVFILNIWNFTALLVQIPYIIIALIFSSVYDAILNVNFVIVSLVCYYLSYLKKYTSAYRLIVFSYPILLTLIMWRFGEGKNILMVFVVIGLAVPFFFDDIKSIIIGSLYFIVWALIASYIQIPSFLLEQSQIASLLFGIVNLVTSVGVGIMFVFILNQENLKFEKDIINQNEELQTQKDSLFELHKELSHQNLALQESNLIIKHKNETITDSIHYAQNIQKAILPLEETLKTYLNDYFVLFQQRDVVSGDFYYFEAKNNKQILAAIDCTGHGVPGAFMTMIASEMLNEIIQNKNITEPDLILNELHKSIRKSLKQTESNNKDGMDMAIITIDNVNKKVNFAGAKNPLIYIQNEELYHIKGDKMTIGGEQREAERIFTKHIIDINIPTIFYLFSDGYQDQFGGKEGKKFMISQMKNLFLEIHSKEMNTQKEILIQKINDWMLQSNEKQIDDIIVIGIRV